MLKSVDAHVRQNLVACLALFVALGGTAHAAATVGSAEIIDESILSADIKNGEVKNSDIAVDTVGSTRLVNLGVLNRTRARTR